MNFRSTSSEKVMTALLTAKPDKEEELLQTLRSLLAQIREEPGNLESLVTRSVDSPHIFIVYLAWQDGETLAACMGSEAFQILLGASSTLSLPAQFHFIADPTRLSAEVTNRVRGLEPFVGPNQG